MYTTNAAPAFRFHAGSSTFKVMRRPTRRQSLVLAFIQEHISHRGYPPTFREISRHFSLSGPNAAAKHVDALERKGLLRRDPGVSRGMEVVGGGSPPETGGAVRVPVLGRVPAGPLSLAYEETESTVVLDRSLAGEGAFLLRVTGDSMTGDHILPGDLVLVRKQESADDGDLVVVLVEEEATLKRFSRTADGVVLRPSNPQYKPIRLSEGSGTVRIIGKVRAVIRITNR